MEGGRVAGDRSDIERWAESRCCGSCQYHDLNRRTLVLHRVYCDRFRLLMVEVYEAAEAQAAEGQRLMSTVREARDAFAGEVV